MRSHSPKDGFVLAFALVMLAIATIVLGGLYTLVSMTARQSIIYEGRNTCRLAAQSAIEYVKPAIEKTPSAVRKSKLARVQVLPTAGSICQMAEPRLVPLAPITPCPARTS